MSPEMIHNKSYDYKIDIWALGILLFEMIAGHAPFRGGRPEEILEQMETKILFCDRFCKKLIT
jgi:serine/threonine protein kinase